MAIFSLIKANARIGELEVKVTELEGKLEQALSVGPAAAQALKDKEAECLALIEANNELTKENEAAKEAVTNFEAKVKEYGALEAQKVTASIGAAPVKAQPETQSAKVISRSDYDAMTPASRLAFFKAGGKLSV